ncbi:hypothetical protein HKO22_09775 [Peptoniphilus sp. AGMB00490]|uniref:Uncharacterized protein n=1 Tax=Peptoniphilus faecalis TaxID=2731255 RepID=A0A848RDQ2_9FIRM|nr:hypothetical protein [Peptoniphilus faecalis]NMW86008.1 hypothetical protein [Peptoniphilus faecalis]
MKKKFYIKRAFLLLLMMTLISCKSQEKASVENSSNTKEAIEENVNKEKDAKMESELFVEKENPRIVAMSVKSAKALKVLDYENVVGVPNGAESLYPDASAIGDEKNPDFKLVNNLSPDFLVTDKSVSYDKPLGQKVDDIDYASASFETLEDTKNGLMYFAKGLGLEENSTKEKIDSMKENI